MSEAKHPRRLWYARRDGVVRGPYPEQQLSRYILLGRIRECDQLRVQDGEWAALSHYPELVPEVMKLPPTEAHLRELALARWRADERGSTDRRRGEVPRSGARERRAGVERRGPGDDFQRCGQTGYRVSERTPEDVEGYQGVVELAVLLALFLVLSYLVGPLGA